MKRLFLLGGILFVCSAMQINAQSATSVTSTSTTQNVEQINVSDGTNTTAVSAPPVFVNTGNPMQDALNYKAAKDKWVAENPDLYNAEVEKLKANHKEETNKEGIDKMKIQSEKQPEKNSTNN